MRVSSFQLERLDSAWWCKTAMTHHYALSRVHRYLPTANRNHPSTRPRILHCCPHPFQRGRELWRRIFHNYRPFALPSNLLHLVNNVFQVRRVRMGPRCLVNLKTQERQVCRSGRSGKSVPVSARSVNARCKRKRERAGEGRW